MIARRLSLASLALAFAAVSSCHDGSSGPAPATPAAGPTFDGMIGIGPAEGFPVSPFAFGIPLDGERMTRLFGHGSRGITDFSALHCEPDGRVLAIVAVTNELVELDRTSGLATSFGSLGPGIAEDMTVRHGTVWFTDVTFDAIVGVDLTTGARTLLPTGFFDVRALAWHEALDTFFVCDLFTDQLITIDPQSGAVAVVGPCDTDYLSYDRDTQTLWSRNGTQLRTVDSATAALGPNMAHSPSSSGGFAFDSVGGGFLQILEPTTRLSSWTPGGAISSVPLSLQNVTSYTVLGDGTLLVRGGGSPAQFFEIDRTTGHWSPSPLLPTGIATGASILTYDPAIDTIYATSGTTLFESASPFAEFTSLGALALTPNSGIAVEALSGQLRGANNTQIYSIALSPPSASVLATVGTILEGLSMGPTSGVLHALAGNGTMFEVDPTTGALSPSALSMRPVVTANGNGLAYDHDSDEFITHSDRFVVRGSDGVFTSPGSWPIRNVRAIARDGDSGRVYLLGEGALFRLHPDFGLENIGPLASIECASYDTKRDLIGGFLGSTFVRVSPLTSTSSGTSTSGGVVVALAYDALLDIYWGIDAFNHELVRIDPVAGWYTPVGPLGTNDVRGLALDPEERRLFGVDADSGRPVEIDMTTGAATPIGPPGWVPADAIWGG